MSPTVSATNAETTFKEVCLRQTGAGGREGRRAAVTEEGSNSDISINTASEKNTVSVSKTGWNLSPLRPDSPEKEGRTFERERASRANISSVPPAVRPRPAVHPPQVAADRVALSTNLISPLSSPDRPTDRKYSPKEKCRIADCHIIIHLALIGQIQGSL